MLLYLVGPQKIQNELLCNHISKFFNSPCPCHGHFPPVRDAGTPKDETTLVLVDCCVKNATELWSDLQFYKVKGLQTYIALFNLRPLLRGKIEKEAIANSVRGVFFMDESLDRMLKGLQHIVKGELWYSRDILSEFLSEMKDVSFHTNKKVTPLTSRETEILYLVASGFKNSEISEKLFVSPHTVRTHLYNLYKKINAPNRIQAILWAREYLSLLQ